jgi:hypothetical protein
MRLTIKSIYSVANASICTRVKISQVHGWKSWVYTLGDYVYRTQVLCSSLCEVKFNLEIIMNTHTHTLE